MPDNRGTHNFRGFISFEGIEGSGKSTQVKLVADHLKSRGLDVLTTEEPGGTNISRKIRGILLDAGNQMDPMTELLLYNAARAQLAREIIYPALSRGVIVITDRFSDSTLAYQGYARGMDPAVIRALDDMAAPELKPSLTFLLDMDVEEGLRRNRAAKKEDRFELETVEFHRKVRNGYLQIASEEPDRIKIVDASGSVSDTNKKVMEILESQWL